ncbi:MAG: CatA-like O-acetyltransferase [Flavitalea sp.]
MKKKIHIEDWARKDHFQFFSRFEEPFFGITVSVECTSAYEYCKSNGHSFFLYYLYQSLRAVNESENFRYRIIDGEYMNMRKSMRLLPSTEPTEPLGFPIFPGKQLSKNLYPPQTRKLKSEIGERTDSRTEWRKCYSLFFNSLAEV